MRAVPPLARNLALLAVVAAVLTALGQFGANVLGLLLLLLNAALLVGICYFGYTLWRANRGTISLMDDRLKITLYVSVAALVVLVLSSFFWVNSGLSALVFFVLLGALGYVIYRVWEESRRYYY